jgi:hypothetical protein
LHERAVADHVREHNRGELAMFCAVLGHIAATCVRAYQNAVCKAKFLRQRVRRSKLLGTRFLPMRKILTSHYVVGAIFVGAPMVPGGGLFDSLQPLLPCNLAVLIQSIGYRRGCSSLALLPLQHDFKSLGAIGGSGTQGVRASLSAP